jgi:hypothetical protein
MKQKITEVRRLNNCEAEPWIVDILAATGFDNQAGYVQPDGTAGSCHEYETKPCAEAAEVLYIAKMKPSAGETPLGDKKQWGHPGFYELLEQMADLHSRKNHDYAGESDPLKNLRACERLNLKPFLGVLVRLQDKWSRLEEFVKSGQLMVKNESVIDTLMDNAVYSLLAIILYQEQLDKESNDVGR